MRTRIVAVLSGALFVLSGCSGCDPAPEPTPQPTPGRHAISGTITRAWGGALAGVTVTLGGAASASSVTGADGRFSFPDLADGTYTVTPALAGYAFTPSAPSVALSGADATRDFSADGARTVSGRITTVWGTSLENASVALSGGGVTKAPVLTDVAGLYSFDVPDGSYTLSATLAGYEVTPLDHASVVVNGADETQDFSADGAYAISGTVETVWSTPLENASVALSGGGVTKSPASTDAAGLYSIRVPDGTYTLTATFPGYDLTPTDPIVIVSGSGETQGFFADGAYTISGTVLTAWATALEGASVALSGGGVIKDPAVTDGSGRYSFKVPDGAFTVTAALAGYAFTPPDPAVLVSGASETQDFSADGAYAISGTITGSVQAGVSVALSGGGVVKPAAISGETGFYSFTGIPNGAYTLTPTFSGHGFTPADPSVVVSGANATQDFSSHGAAGTYSISGRVLDTLGAGLAGMTVRLSGAVNAIRKTDETGSYTFAGLEPDQAYTVVQATFGYQSSPPSDTRVVTGDVTGVDFTAFPNGPSASTYGGSLAYGGSRTGPVYLTIEDAGSGGPAAGTGLTSAPAPWSGRAFTVRNVPINRPQLTVRAWIDTLGIGRFHAGADPSVTATFDASGPTSVGELTLVDPVSNPTVASAARVKTTVSGGGVVAVVYDGPRDERGGELADSYHVYWNDSATVDSTHTLGERIVPAGPDFAIVHGLTNGTPYWFRVEAWLGGSPMSGQTADAGPVTPAALAGDAAVSGTVTHPAVSSPSALYVIAQGSKGPDGAHLLRVVPTGTQTAWSMSIPAGSYQLFAFIDVGDDGGVLTGEPAGFPGPNGAGVTLLAAGSNDGKQLAIPGGAGSASLTTSLWATPYGSWSQLNLGVTSGEKVPLAAAVTGPGLRGPVDLGVSRDGGTSISLNAQVGTYPILPYVGDAYTFAITWSNGDVDTFQRTVTGLFGAPPAIVAPADGETGVSLVPTFEWTPPVGAPGAYGYEIQVGALEGDAVWETFLPGNLTTVAYGEDGTAQAPLSSMTPYGWRIRAIDANGNEATSEAGFTTAAAPMRLYDPLTATTLDGQRWGTPLFGRSTDFGRLQLSVEADDMQARTIQNQTYTNSIGVAAAGRRVTAFRAVVSVPSTSVARTGTAVAYGAVRLIYQPQENRGLPPPINNRNLLAAGLELFEGGSGLQIRRRFFHCDDDPCVAIGDSDIDFSDPVGFVGTGATAVAAAAYDTPYTFEVVLDETTGVFTWSVQGGAYATAVSGTADVSRWVPTVAMTLNSASDGFATAQLAARLSDDVGGSGARLTAEYDDVAVGFDGAAASPWDDFASGFISPARWGFVDSDVWLQAGSLHVSSELTTAANGQFGEGTTVNLMYPAPFDAIQADVAVAAASIPYLTVPGSGGNVALNAAFYNEGGVGAGPNRATGDIRGRITLTTGGANYSVIRCASANCTAASGIVSGPLSQGSRPFGLGTVHTLLMRWNAAAGTMTFAIDDATPVTVGQPTLPAAASASANLPLSFLSTNVNVGSGATTGTTASIEATVNDVRVAP